MKRGLTAIAMGRYRGWGRSVAKSAAFRKALAALLAAPDAACLTAHSDRRVYPLPWEGRTYYVKLYLVRSFKARLQSLVGRNKAQNAWRYAHRLTENDIPTPLAVARLRRVHWDGRREEILVSEGVAGAPLRSVLDRPMPPVERRSLVRAVAQFLALLHDQGIYHGDLTARNIMVTLDAKEGREGRIFLIDLDAIRSVGGISARRQIKNLDELGRNFHDLGKVSVQDRLRFLVYYTAARRSPAIPLKELSTRVCARTAVRMQAVGLDFIPPNGNAAVS